MKRKRVILMVAVLLTFVISGIMLMEYYYRGGDASLETALYWGSTGNSVSEVQRKLKQWGYYNGDIDGVYGSLTFEAVRLFQQRNGLQVDGIVGEQTAAAIGISLTGAGGGSYTQSGGGGNSGDLYLMARAIHGEARGEPYLGKVAVGAVIMNRVRSPKFPNTIAGVVYQPGAFTAVDDGQINLTPDEESMRAARDAMNGWDPTYGAIYYYNPATSTSAWIWTRPVHLTIGKHNFAT